MRLDYLTIFPEYLDALRLSLPGKAVDKGLLELHVHDLRTWTHDRHRTVDDTPYGGGAGMVLKPEPFGEALDELAVDGATVVVPTPAGRPFTQPLARELATRERLVFLCGRYEGIDQRVLDHVATRAELVEVSLGDYVLNGGEVAALAMTEAVVRLLPGFMGNAASLVEESHESGLLEHPVYTKPAAWRGHEVPPVLMSGNHGAIAAWRHDRALARTAERRPDLLPATAVASEWVVEPAVRADAGELWTLQRACWVTEAVVNDELRIPALHEELDDVVAGLGEWRTWVVRVDGRLVGSVRARTTATERGEVWEIGRLMVAPDLRGRGLGRVLLEHAEQAAPGSATAYRLVTGARSEANLRRYKRAGYRVVEVQDGPAGPAVLVKRISAR
ncbi:tRNA (guanosine(37)-N1)-methyltransferase TrmD [Nocardioides marinus]|uniref:tRNA (guanine-N(1)-)-methyltransferase n=1 Tax=Nocardioides marinus TaxID=374514 RepID=A0A7Y9YGA6_9ACTN|nr:tRNA (guanine37-N1)-methyltransferase [Nocardioides marinus]